MCVSVVWCRDVAVPLLLVTGVGELLQPYPISQQWHWDQSVLWKGMGLSLAARFALENLDANDTT